jgi:hypothetical protein
MNDCPDGEIRDLLPDLVHERLDAAELDRLKAHITGCADCTAEIALLARIRASAEGRAPVVDVNRVVSSLPRAGRSSTRWSRNAGVRLAAGLVVLLASASWLRQASRSDESQSTVDQPVVVAQGPTVQGAESAQAVTSSPRAIRARTATAASGRQISIDDDLTDLSDRELESLLGALDSFDGVMRVEPASLEPILESERLR